MDIQGSRMYSKFYFGFDIGSISINTVVMDMEGNVKLDHYDYCHGKPFEKLKEILWIKAKKGKNGRNISQN